MTESRSHTDDRGPELDGVRIGRPATGALIDAGHTSRPWIRSSPSAGRR